MASVTVPAAPKYAISEDQWVSLGARFRSVARAIEHPGPNDKNFTLDSFIVYLSTQLHKNLGIEVSGRYDDEGGVRLLDAFARVEFNDYVNIWAGRVIPPSDRANLDGPYFMVAFDFPFVQNYPQIYVGRDTGIAFWGQPGGGKINYAMGVFAGCRSGNPCANSTTHGEDFLYTGRFNINFWDPEPGYYTSSTYYGEKNLLALGGSFMFQKNATGTVRDRGNFFGWNIDFLLEKKLYNEGVVTLQTSYYNYDLDGKPNPALVEGNGYYALAAFLLPKKLGIGKFQPLVRYQNLNRSDNGKDHARWEAGVNYIIMGHNARVSLMFAHDEIHGRANRDEVLLGLQLQY